MKAFIEYFRHLTHTADGEKPLFEVVGKEFAKDSGWSRFVGGDPQVVYDDTATDGQCLRLPVVADGDTSRAWSTTTRLTCASISRRESDARLGCSFRST